MLIICDPHFLRSKNVRKIVGESFHTSVMRQGEEILHYVVYKELETRNLHHLITNESILLQRIFRLETNHFYLYSAI